MKEESNVELQQLLDEVEFCALEIFAAENQWIFVCLFVCLFFFSGKIEECSFIGYDMANK